MTKLARVRLDDAASDDIYGLQEEDVRFFPSGSQLLDLVLGGGWARGRTANIVGDSSTGKTQLMIEAMTTYAIAEPEGRIKYNDAEGAFDEEYATRLGLPVDRVEFAEDVLTIEQQMEDLEKFIKDADGPGLYIVDSVDALTDQAEIDRKKVTDGSYGTGKAKRMSELFRRNSQNMAEKDITFLLVSQIRENVGASFMGKKYTRACARPLQFYSSQVVWLNHMGKIERTRGGIKRPIAIKVQAKNEKNKCGTPYRRCDMVLSFNFGLEDIQPGLEFLIEAGRTAEVGMSKDAAKKYISNTLPKLDSVEYRKMRKKVNAAVREVWADVEEDFKPTIRKYGD